MALRVTCPGCQTSLELDDDARGRKVRCSECEKVLSIPAAGGSRANRAKQELVKEGSGRKMPPAVEEDEERDEARDEDRPAKKKKKKKGERGSRGGIAVNFGINSVYVLVGGVFILILAGAGTGTYFVLREPPEAPAAKLANAPVPPPPMANPARKIIPGIKDGNPDKKGGTYVISSVRGAGYRLERRSELSNIGKAYIQFFDEYKGAARTEENFLKYIKRDFGVIHDYIKDGYYQMNMKAGLDGDSIICYERDIDTGDRYLCVRGDGSVDYVPLEVWKKALGKP